MKLKQYKILMPVFIIALVFFAGTIYVSAAPAAKLPDELKQPTGESFTAEMHGDEWFNYWMLTDSGAVIAKSEDGFWYYAKYLNDKITAGSKKVKIDAEPKDVVKKEQLQKKSKSAIQKAQALYNVEALPQKISLAGTTQKILVLLVEFTNVNIKYSEADWSKEIFSMDTNSVNKYYSEVSGGTFRFLPAEETAGNDGVNDGVIKVRLNYGHPNTAGTIDQKNRDIVINALEAADPYINYDSFDTDKNGFISSNELHIVTIIAGYECGYHAKSPSVWSHRWSLGNQGVSCDGVILGDYRNRGSYTQQGEVYGDSYISDYMATIGNICHELGHDLGLPDLYDTDGSSRGVGIHSLMGSGNWASGVDGKAGSSPTHLDPWSKIELGFINPTVVQEIGTFLMHATGNPNYNVLKIPTASPNEYFLVENREFYGFDRGLYTYCKSGGIAVWHVDDNIMNDAQRRKANNVNIDETHKALDLEEASEKALGYRQLDSNEDLVQKGYNHYFYVGNLTTFSAITLPNSKMYDGSDSSISIITPSNSGSIMEVSVKRPVVTISPVKGIGKEGRQYRAEIKLEGGFALSSIDLELKYDVNFMSVKNVTAGSISADVSVDGNSTPGAIYFSAHYSSPGNFSSQATVLTIDFDLLKYGTTEITIEKCILKDSKDRVIVCTTSNGTLEIKPIVGSLSGKINLQNRSNHSDITVVVDGMEIQGSTDEEGSILINNIPVGEQTLIISYNYYLTKKLIVNILEDETVDFGAIDLSAGDANEDNTVDEADLEILKASYRAFKNGTGYNAAADFNNDGVVDLVDLGMLVTNLGMSGDLMEKSHQMTSSGP